MPAPDRSVEPSRLCDDNQTVSEVLFTTSPRPGRASRRVWRALAIALILVGSLALTWAREGR